MARSDPSIFITVIAEQSKEGCYDFDRSPSYHIAGAPYFYRLNWRRLALDSAIGECRLLALSRHQRHHSRLYQPRAAAHGHRGAHRVSSCAQRAAPEDWADIALQMADRCGSLSQPDFEEKFSTLRRNILEMEEKAEAKRPD